MTITDILLVALILVEVGVFIAIRVKPVIPTEKQLTKMSNMSCDVRDARDAEIRKMYSAEERFYRKHVAAKMSGKP
jgi:DNA repair photolyase